VNRAGATLRDAATVFRAGQADILPDCPEQRRGVIDIDVVVFAIDIKAKHSRTSSGEIFRSTHLETGWLNLDSQTVIRLFQINNRADCLFRERSSRVDEVFRRLKRLLNMFSRVQLSADMAVQQ
jgi:hypothetical protein